MKGFLHTATFDSRAWKNTAEKEKKRLLNFHFYLSRAWWLPTDFYYCLMWQNYLWSSRLLLPVMMMLLLLLLSKWHYQWYFYFCTWLNIVHHDRFPFNLLHFLMSSFIYFIAQSFHMQRISSDNKEIDFMWVWCVMRRKKSIDLQIFIVSFSHQKHIKSDCVQLRRRVATVRT